MYVHIGNDVNLQDKDIIAILNIGRGDSEKNLKSVLQYLKISDKIIDVSEENKKSLIITTKAGENFGYVTNISTGTLAKRTKLNLSRKTN